MLELAPTKILGYDKMVSTHVASEQVASKFRTILGKVSDLQYQGIFSIGKLVNMVMFAPTPILEKRKT